MFKILVFNLNKKLILIVVTCMLLACLVKMITVVLSRVPLAKTTSLCVDPGKTVLGYAGLHAVPPTVTPRH